MANYKIKKYDGSNAIIPELIDKSDTVDSSTSLLFYSKGYNYGSAMNTNFLRLMEHFSSDDKPANPVIGQIWFNKNTKISYVYNGVAWDELKTRSSIPQELTWSGTFTQNATYLGTTISGTVSVSSITCVFNNTLSINSNIALSDYLITGTIPNDLTLNVTVNSILNTVNFTLSGTIPNSTPTFNFKITFSEHAFTNVMDAQAVNNISNTCVIQMDNTAITTTTTAAPTTTSTTLPATSTTTTALVTTTTTTAAASLVLSNYSSIKLGITWGGNVDLDTVVAAYDSSGICTFMSTITNPTTITGVTYGGDIRTGGIEEYYDIDLTQLSCSKLVLGILEYTSNSFLTMSSLSTRIVDNASSSNIAQFTLNTISKDVSNTPNTTCVVGVFTKVGNDWSFASYQKLINSHNGMHAIYPGDNYSLLGL